MRPAIWEGQTVELVADPESLGLGLAGDELGLEPSEVVAEVVGSKTAVLPTSVHNGAGVRGTAMSSAGLLARISGSGA